MKSIKPKQTDHRESLTDTGPELCAANLAFDQLAEEIAFSHFRRASLDLTSHPETPSTYTY